MIKIFKRIRYSLLEKTKTGKSASPFGKYLLYAFGEIILVVIGILIALQINNLNENRKDRNLEQEILKQLKKEYQINLQQLEDKIEMRKTLINAAKKGLYHLDTPGIAHRDSLFSYLSTLTNTPTYDPINNDLISSGRIRLITNKELNQRLTQWSTDIIQLGEIEKEYEGNYRNILMPYIIKKGIGREVDNAYWEIENNFTFLMDKKHMENKPVTGKSRNPIHLEDLQNDKELEGIMSNAIYINYIANIESISLRERIIDILDLLNTSIK